MKLRERLQNPCFGPVGPYLATANPINMAHSRWRYGNHYVRNALVAAIAGGICSALVGIAVLLAWFSGVRQPFLMSLATAVVAIIVGSTCAYLAWVWPRVSGRSLGVQRAAGALTAIIGFSALGHRIFGWRYGLEFSDSLLVPNLLTSLDISALGVALLFLDRAFRIAQALLVLVAAAVLVTLTTHAYGAALISRRFGLEQLAHIPVLETSMPVSILSLVLLLSILSTRPDRGIISMTTSEELDGVMARRLFLSFLSVPVLLIVVALIGRPGDVHFDVWIFSGMTASAVAIFSFLVWSAARKMKALITDQKAADRELKKAQELLTKAERIAELGSWDWNLQTNELEWSEEIYRLFGLTRLVFGGTYQAFLDSVHPEDRDYVIGEVNKALNEDNHYSIDHRILRPDGTVYWVHEEAEVSADEAGKPIRMIGTVHNITSRKLTEQMLRAAEAKFRGLIEYAHDAIIVMNEQGRIEFANQQFSKWFGYTSYEVSGLSIDKLMPDHVNSILTKYQKLRAEDPAAKLYGENIDSVGKRKNGETFFVEVSLGPMAFDSGYLVAAMVRDVTERKRLEREQAVLLKTSQELSATLDYENSWRKVAGLIVPDMADWCVVDRVVESPAGGYRIERVAAGHVDPSKSALIKEIEKFPPQLEETWGAARVIKTGVPEVIAYLPNDELPSRARTPRHLELLEALGLQSLLVVPLVARGRTIGAISMVFGPSGRRYELRDLQFATEVASRCSIALENARLFYESQRDVRVREDLLAIVSHDLRSPLSSILLSTELLAYSNLPANLPAKLPEESRKWIDKIVENIRHAATHMQRLIGDLLDFAKIQAGTFSVAPKPIVVDELMARFAESIIPEAKKKKLEFRLELARDLPEIQCDPDRLHQVLANLVGNAIKFTPSGGSVRLKAHPFFGGIHISVQDTGPGLSPEQLAHVFERYWQADMARRGGAGLGLSISKGIVQAHGGRIWAECELGKGCTFHFILPQHARPQIPKGERAA